MKTGSLQSDRTVHRAGPAVKAACEELTEAHAKAAKDSAKVTGLPTLHTACKRVEEGLLCPPKP